MKSLYASAFFFTVVLLCYGIIRAEKRQSSIARIIEGVETKEQLEYLTGIGCDMFQGYYFAKPMEVKQFEEKYM